MDLADVAELFQFGDTFTHDRKLARAVVNFLDGDGSSSASINDAFVILDGNEQAFVIKDRPILLDESVDPGLNVGFKMGQVELCAQFLPVNGLDICRGEIRVDIIEWWRGMLSFAENSATIDILQEGVKLVGLIGESSIVIEDVIRSLPLLGLGRDSNGRRPVGGFGLCVHRRWISGDVMGRPERVEE